MPKTIELCVYDSLFQKRAAIDPILLKSVIARDESLKIEIANDVETVFAFDDEHHVWSPILRLHEQFPAISARPILSHPYAYYKLTEVADSTSACLYSEGNLLYVPGYGMLVDPEENKHIEATPEALGQLVRQGVGVKEAINKLQELKELTPDEAPVAPASVTEEPAIVAASVPTAIHSEIVEGTEETVYSIATTDISEETELPVQPEAEIPLAPTAVDKEEAVFETIPTEKAALPSIDIAQPATQTEQPSLPVEAVAPVATVPQPTVTKTAAFPQQETLASQPSVSPKKRIKPALVVAVLVAIAAIIFLILK